MIDDSIEGVDDAFDASRSDEMRWRVGGLGLIVKGGFLVLVDVHNQFIDVDIDEIRRSGHFAI